MNMARLKQLQITGGYGSEMVFLDQKINRCGWISANTGSYHKFDIGIDDYLKRKYAGLL